MGDAGVGHSVAIIPEREEMIEHEVVHHEHRDRGHDGHRHHVPHEGAVGAHVTLMPAADAADRRWEDARAARPWRTHRMIRSSPSLPPPFFHLAEAPDITGDRKVKSGMNPSGGSLRARAARTRVRFGLRWAGGRAARTI